MPKIQVTHAIAHMGFKNRVMVACIYFVPRGGGSHVLSLNHRRHNNAVDKYQRRRLWEAAESEALEAQLARRVGAGGAVMDALAHRSGGSPPAVAQAGRFPEGPHRL